MIRTITRCFSSKAAFTSAVWSIPGQGKKQGEDAYFLGTESLGVADGVGGWALYNVDPSRYAWALMTKIESVLPKSKSPREAIKWGSRQVTEKGSSTCCLLMLADRELHFGNLGDSGFYLFRKLETASEMFFKSQPTLHGFNFPYQLGTNGDSYEKASYQSITVKDQDIVVLFTDGMSDNMFDSQVLGIVNDHKINGMQELAKTLALTAEKQSLNKKWDSPFAIECRKAKRQWRGGKIDDITVIAAQINFT